jgi:23S rRNA pseudouridine2605 synthase
MVELRAEKETMLDLNKDNTSRKRERAKSQKIRRAVKRHEERVSTPAGRGRSNGRRKPSTRTATGGGQGQNRSEQGRSTSRSGRNNRRG